MSLPLLAFVAAAIVAAVSAWLNADPAARLLAAAVGLVALGLALSV